MDNNVLSLSKKEEKKDAQAKVENFLLKHRQVILPVIGVIVVAGIAVCVSLTVLDAGKKKNLAAIDAIEYTFTKNNADIADAELESRQNAALDALKPYLSKSGIAGVRASMLAADIYFQKKDYSSSLNSWLNAAAGDEHAYTSPVCYYNAGICAEELGDNANAVSYFEKASNKADFYLAPHALFSLGRVYESSSDYEKAVTAYQKLIDNYADDEYTKLAHDRVIALKTDGKVSN